MRLIHHEYEARLVWHVESPLVSENYMLGLERYVLCSLPNIARSLEGFYFKYRDLMPFL